MLNGALVTESTTAFTYGDGYRQSHPGADHHVGSRPVLTAPEQRLALDLATRLRE